MRLFLTCLLCKQRSMRKLPAAPTLAAAAAMRCTGKAEVYYAVQESGAGLRREAVARSGRVAELEAALDQRAVRQDVADGRIQRRCRAWHGLAHRPAAQRRDWRARGVGAFDIVDLAAVAENDLLLYVIPNDEPSALIGHLAGRMQNGEIAADRFRGSVARLMSMQLVALI